MYIYASVCVDKCFVWMSVLCGQVFAYSIYQVIEPEATDINNKNWVE